MQIIFETSIDKYKGEFPTDFHVIPRIGEKVRTKHYKKELPFNHLEVKDVIYLNKNTVIVELHLSELQHMQNKDNRLNVF